MCFTSPQALVGLDPHCAVDISLNKGMFLYPEDLLNCRCFATTVWQRMRKCGRPALSTSSWGASTRPAPSPCCLDWPQSPPCWSCTSSWLPCMGWAASSSPGPPSSKPCTQRINAVHWERACQCLTLFCALFWAVVHVNPQGQYCWLPNPSWRHCMI